MKTAKKYPIAYELSCPECGEPVYAPCGSTYWTREEVERANPVQHCPGGHDFKMPKF